METIRDDVHLLLFPIQTSLLLGSHTFSALLHLRGWGDPPAFSTAVLTSASSPSVSRETHCNQSGLLSSLLRPLSQHFPTAYKIAQDSHLLTLPCSHIFLSSPIFTQNINTQKFSLPADSPPPWKLPSVFTTWLKRVLPSAPKAMDGLQSLSG